MVIGDTMAPPDYQPILDLRREAARQKRGYLFEQLIREILPWSYRPALAVKGETEQLDAFFEWNGWYFLVEAKAKKSTIQAGSHDWEDFELKVTRRGGMCIGLYCSLWEVHDRVYDRIKSLNENKCTTIIIAGNRWDELHKHQLPLDEFLQYVIFYARSTYMSRAPNVEIIKKWSMDRDTTTKKVGQIGQALSATFLRRHRLPRHSSIYLRREVDKEIADLAASLRPSRLTQTERNDVRPDGSDVRRARARPTQFAIVKDLSGSGKTTLSVELALERERFFGAAKAALETDIDQLPAHLSRIGKDFGIRELQVADKPVVYAIDSLDEAATLPHKKNEIKALFKSVEELNRIASAYGMLAYPLLGLHPVSQTPS
jgi:hypothetical protein